ncbi:MAG TPA: DNA/RNA nuclease SfsA [Candidatus Enterenecus stercoripullorum]|nr:DNA/RNA nuclease SfsA [Candidatus Enterenecus stercoripullorum]
MRYHAVRPARFLSRPNRFIAQVELGGREETVHVKNTGRCRELLVPGRTVYLEESSNPQRKTRFDLIAVDKDGLLINMDAQAPNQVFAEWAGAGHFRENLTLLRPETTWGGSRFDFYWEDAAGARGFVEVKGCTLEERGLAMFPDAPTLRGVKHLRELARAQGEGYECSVCIVLQMKGCRRFCPNERTHPEFGQALREAAQAGVQVLALDCRAAPDRLEIDGPVPVSLTMESNP